MACVRLAFRAYIDYYRRHRKTYPVKAQWESVALKGKPIPHGTSRSPRYTSPSESRPVFRLWTNLWATA
jgi:hypothetical protein